MKIEKETLVWFTSDNGGLPKIEPPTTGGLRDFKGSMYEGGLRVPAVIEWPQKIRASRSVPIRRVPVDIFPTIAEIVGLPPKAMLNPVDGESLLPLFDNEPKSRSKPLIFSSRGRMAVIDNQWKFLSQPQGEGRKLEMFDLSKIFPKARICSGPIILAPRSSERSSMKRDNPFPIASTGWITRRNKWMSNLREPFGPKSPNTENTSKTGRTGPNTKVDSETRNGKFI